MITDEDKIQVKRIAQKYQVGRVYLFGSSINSQKASKDIDLAVDGIIGSDFFKFYGELIFNLSKPVDVIDLKKKSVLNDMVKREGIILYG